MKGRHLGHALDSYSGRTSTQALVARDHITGLDKSVIARLSGSHPLLAELREGIDIELIIREDHEILEMLRISTGVVVKPVQRIVDTCRTKHGERARRARR